MTGPGPSADADKDALADVIFGAGNWVVCPSCPDSLGNPSRHHRLAHADGHEPL